MTNVKAINMEYSECVFVALVTEPIASGWLKVRRYAEVPKQDGHLPLLSIYMAIVWRLVNRGSERWGVSSWSFLGGFKGWGLGLEVSTPLREVVLTLRLLMSYVYGAPILDVSRSHTTTQHSR
jgi:hypothetical protein